MELRIELAPQLEIAEQRYPEILNLILEYTKFIDENGDEDGKEYENLIHKLHLLTNKELSKFNLWEYWEEEGAEVLAFRISLPDPLKSDQFSKEELTEVIRRLKTFEAGTAEGFKEHFKYYLADYYHQLLALNFKKYTYQLFNRQKDKKGNYFEYSVEEISEKISPGH
ncbi:hypothetical protein SAMN05421820_106357 [Pedobacter steynii]|uniref:Uncharacterized protein n=1 Tax=Pedobacter steynii TaxID=430522 RepID=A0A1G9Z855_9SPHI|nr:hypothetical protein [Pedobacter steynii]NQX39955.1 hypothetical protein [Pedobacter steynii]SDN16573.1 hypothetical protein SAMN05421820_106357 [Pedobacter steynii]